MGFWHSGERRYRLFSDQERKEFGERRREEMSKAWHEKYISKWTLLSVRGWTEAAIDEFLGEPVNNGTPTLAFYRYRVERAEKSKRWKEFQEKQRMKDMEWELAYSKAELKRRDPIWTESAVARFLTNPIRRGRLARYRIEDVREAEQSEEFKKWMEVKVGSHRKT